MKFSIIIPTYNKAGLLKTCIDSIIKYTDLSETEIIVVSNGCKDETHDLLIKYIAKLKAGFDFIELSDPVGYTRAINSGIAIAKGEYLIFLNNDTQLLEQEKNTWIDLLVKPFETEFRVGVTGPMMTTHETTDRNFIIFFCAMTRRSIIAAHGNLDTIFSPGYGEDVDFCHRLEDAGFKIVQVPGISTEYYGDKRMTGNFPIFHEGNVTFKNWPGGEDLIAQNNETLRQRYNDIKVDLTRAKKCDGYMSDAEMLWLATQAKKNNIIIEIGSWHGRSSRAIADNLPHDGVLICVDTWKGSIDEQETNHVSAKMNGGDHAFIEFSENTIDLILLGKVIPLRMASVNAAKLLHSQGVRADMIFVDAGHTYPEVKEDVACWEPLVKTGGILCGHDYYHHGPIWEGVRQAVDEIFGHRGTGMGYLENNSIWSHVITREKNAIKLRAPAIFDCFPFNNELDILEERLSTLYDTVDRFVIVEAKMTHANVQKPLNFNLNVDRFAKYLNKITYLVVESCPVSDPWGIERYQRDFIMNGLKDCQPNDIIIISDCDEIPNPTSIKKYDLNDGIAAFSMDLYYYNKNTLAEKKWLEAKILPYELLQKLTPCGARYSQNYTTIFHGGMHLSYFGDVDKIIKKIEDTAHQEYNTPENKDPEKIAKAIREGKDVFGREDVKFNWTIND